MQKSVSRHRHTVGSSSKASGAKAKSRTKATVSCCSHSQSSHSHPSCAFGIGPAAAGLTQYGDDIVAPHGRHPQRHAERYDGEINHNIHVLEDLSARQLIDYCSGVSAKLSSTLLALNHAQMPFNQPLTSATDSFVRQDCSKVLTHFSDALEGAINAFCAVEHIALNQRDVLDDKIADSFRSRMARRRH
jgi:hypothetical protein